MSYHSKTVLSKVKNQIPRHLYMLKLAITSCRMIAYASVQESGNSTFIHSRLQKTSAILPMFNQNVPFTAVIC